MPALSGFFYGDSMDRQIVYPGQILPETSLLQMAKDSMVGLAKLSAAMLGTSTMANGFAVTPTGPASLQVVCAPGEIYSLTSIDALAFSTLPADTTHSIMKQGILLDGVTLSCPTPGTTGQSINYLVQVTYQDSDSAPVLLPYYNSANPSLPFSGMGNNGLTQNTNRKGVAVVAVKAGASAVTGSQVTPAPDSGYVGLYVVTVAYGQTTITSGNINLAASAPLINSTLHSLAPVFAVSPSVPAGTLTQHAVNVGQMFGGLKGLQTFTSGGTLVVPAGVTTMYASGAGGGGGGGGSGAVSGITSGFSSSGGGGGGAPGASTIRQSFTVTPGQTLTIAIGAAGGGGSAGAAGGTGGVGSAGGASSIAGTAVSITLAGGAGGLGGGGVSAANSVAAAGGSPGGAAAQSGAQGMAVTGYGYNFGGPGGNGGGSPFGAGGGGKSTGTASSGAAASGYGGGGAGACGTVTSSALLGAAGGTGTAGVIFIEW